MPAKVDRSWQVRDAAKRQRAITVVVMDYPATTRIDDEVAEINELADSAHFDVLATHVVKLRRSRADTCVGRGTMETLSEMKSRFQGEIFLFNCELSATQIRNLSGFLSATVNDRNELILLLFSQRAKSHEGKIQVELARRRHELGRLAGLWTHLERQRGGIGLRGGPGEKQIEIDRRLLATKIKRIEKQIDKTTQRRQLARRRRHKNGINTVSLVGYTNAGKSSLFNILSRSSMPANDRLFDTLDTTTRQARTHDGCRYVLSDTVGFIRRLPHELIAGFLATLRDAVDSDVLIIVSDHTRPDWRDRLSLTQRQLADIGVGDKKCIIVQNKIDRLGIPPKVDCSDCGRMRTVFLSCRTRDGVSLLEEVLSESLRSLSHRSV